MDIVTNCVDPDYKMSKYLFYAMGGCFFKYIS